MLMKKVMFHKKKVFGAFSSPILRKTAIELKV